MFRRSLKSKRTSSEVSAKVMARHCSIDFFFTTCSLLALATKHETSRVAALSIAQLVLFCDLDAPTVFALASIHKNRPMCCHALSYFDCARARVKYVVASQSLSEVASTSASTTLSKWSITSSRSTMQSSSSHRRPRRRLSRRGSRRLEVPM